MRAGTSDSEPTRKEEAGRVDGGASQTIKGAVTRCAPGRAPQTWGTAVTSDNGKLIVVEGRWPLPERGK